MPKKKKTTAEKQHAAMWLLVKRNMTDEDFREWIFELTGGKSESSSDLTFEQKNFVIMKLGGRKFNLPNVPTRTQNYRRQKAGVQTIVSATHIDWMHTLWRKVDGRTEAGLESLCLKTIKVARPRTAAECSKVIEAIKSMNRRATQKAKTENQKLEDAA